MKPVIFSVCDDGYHEKFAGSFEASARVNGHAVDIRRHPIRATTEDDRAFMMAWRFRILPELLDKHDAVLLADIDSVIRQPIEIPDEYDIGIFLRLDRHDMRKRSLGSVFYIRGYAKDFAVEMAALMSGPVSWFDDQIALWALYEKYKTRFRFLNFNESFLSWTHNPAAPVWTAKGARKYLDPIFENERLKYDRNGTGRMAQALHQTA